MNAAHLHVTLVHIPIVLVPVGFILLAWGIRKHDLSVTRVSLLMFMVAALIAVPAFLMGGEAEEVVEHIAGVSEDLIEEHEEVADVAFWLTIGLGVLSAIALYAVRVGAVIESVVLKITLALSIVAAGALAYTAYEGGKIRHPEAYESQGQPRQQGHEQGEGD